MRRKQCEIGDPETIVAILGRSRVGRLATTGKDGYPYITPVNYVWWNDSIYFHCAHEGEKIDNIRSDDRVCFEVDIPLAYLDTDFDRSRPTCLVHQFYHCVIVRGRAQMVVDIEEKVAALNALVAAHEGSTAFDPVQENSREVGLCTVVAVRVERVSGKGDLGQKMDPAERSRAARYLKERGLPGDAEAAGLMGGDNG